MRFNDLPGAIRFYDSLMEFLGYPKAGRNEEDAPGDVL